MAVVDLPQKTYHYSLDVIPPWSKSNKLKLNQHFTARDMTPRALTLHLRKTPVYYHIWHFYAMKRDSQAFPDELANRTLATGPGQTLVELAATSLTEEVLMPGTTKHSAARIITTDRITELSHQNEQRLSKKIQKK